MIAFWIFAVVWALYALLILFHLRHVLLLPPAADESDGERDEPRVSVVIAARDEEARIGRSVLDLLGQQGIDLELIVVDDRSTDRTGEILRELAATDDRLRVIRVDTLPPDWLGKSHACHVGAQSARGDWILFSDADVWMKPDVILRAVRSAEAERCEHLCLFPAQQETTLLGRAALLYFSLGMLLFAARANRDRRGSFVGVGAFNLVRATAYRDIGGHLPLRLEVIDDLKLGFLLRRAGFRSRAFATVGELEVHWASTAPEMIRALEKNLFAMMDFSVTRSLLFVLLLVVMVIIPLVGLLGGTPAGIVAFLAMALWALPASIVSRGCGWGVLPALLSPLMGLVFAAALLFSTWSALRNGGVRWRETLYPLETLRRGRVRVNPWIPL